MKKISVLSLLAVLLVPAFIFASEGADDSQYKEGNNPQGPGMNWSEEKKGPPPQSQMGSPGMKEKGMNGMVRPPMGSGAVGSGMVRPPMGPGMKEKGMSGTVRPPVGSGSMFPPKGSGAVRPPFGSGAVGSGMVRPPMGSGASNDKEVTGLLMAINQLSPTDRATLLTTIKEFLKSKGIDPTKYAEIRKEINETRKQTQEELSEIRKNALEESKTKREEMKNKINEVRSQGKATFKEFTITK